MVWDIASTATAAEEDAEWARRPCSSVSTTTRALPMPRSHRRRADVFRRALSWFASLGIQCERLLTDNAKCYTESKIFRSLCKEHGIQQRFTRPYTPQTNRKAERFIQTLKRRWACRHPYRTSEIRAASLQSWVTHYNHKRPHRELGKKPPFARLREARQQRA